MADLSPAAIRSLIADFFSTIGECEIVTLFDVKVKVMLVDECYRPISRDEMLDLARANPLEPQPDAATRQLADCDEYALHLKDMAAAQYRQHSRGGAGQPLPPAVAIVMSQNHAVNLFIEQGAGGKYSIWFIDASRPDLPTTNTPAQVVHMIKQPPVKLIYM
jgi:hypothetical protein